MEVGLLLALFIIFLLIGIPIGVSIGMAIIGLILIVPEVTSFGFVGQAMVTSVYNFTLLAVPFYMLTGAIMQKGGMSRRLIAVGEALVGRKPGGMASVTIFSCLAFGFISGSSPAIVAAVGSIMIPVMIEKKYKASYAAGVTAIAGGLGTIAPPSIQYIIYGTSTGTSVGHLFIAGILPALLMAGIFVVTSNFISKRRGYVGTGLPFDGKEFKKILWDAKWAVLAPIFILGGIYTGIFTPTEAAIFGSVYGIIIGKFVYKELEFKDFPAMFANNGAMFGGVVLTIATATALCSVFSILEVPSSIGNLVSSITDNTYILLLIMNVVMLIIVMFMDAVAAMLVLAPIFTSILVPLGVDPIHLGIVMTVNISLGFCTLPVAVNILTASSISGGEVAPIQKETYAFIGTGIIGLMIITYLPQLSTWLPSLLK